VAAQKDISKLHLQHQQQQQQRSASIQCRVFHIIISVITINILLLAGGHRGAGR